MSSQTKTIFGVVGAVVIAAAVYMLFFKTDPSSALTASSSPVSDAEFTFIQLASEIQPITFDTAILSDTRFLWLVDMQTAVVPEPQGKRDPFAQLSGLQTTTGTTR
jgi:hypothetical protein